MPKSQPLFYFTVPGQEVIHEPFENEVVIVDLARGKYYTAEGSAALAWNLAVSGHSLRQIIDYFVGQYQEPPQDIVNALTRYFDEILDCGLMKADLEVGTVREWSPPAHALPPFAPLALRTRDDLSHLLAVDPPSPELVQKLPKTS